jgi:predicted acetyltransferase
MLAPRLIAPSREFESSYRTYVAEVLANGETLVPFSLTLPHDDFEELLATLSANSRGERIPDTFVPNSTFWLVVDTDIVAVSNLRHRLTPALERRGGHIGYSVRPRSRRQGYGSLILRLTLQEAGKLPVATALITCAKDNVGSTMVIRANGGVLQSEEFVAEHGEVVQRYYVPVVHPNSTPHADARASAVPCKGSSARAGGRGR